MKIYTKRGDNGITDLYDKKNVPKNDKCFDILGTLDELSAHIGVLCASLTTKPTLCQRFVEHLQLSGTVFDCYYERKCFKKDIETLRSIQNKLLDIGSCIATTNTNSISFPVFTKHITELEKEIDMIEQHNTNLTKFILPGVTLADSQAHVCRAVTRRLERLMVLNVQPNIMIYINRLSDYFFVLARYISDCQEMNRY